MKKWIVLFLILSIVYESWAVPKPMESITNYNVLLLHGAYGHYKKDDDGKIDKSKPQGFLESETIPSANDAEDYLGNATIGRYTDNSRINYWLSKEIFEEPEWEKPTQGVHNSCIYHWRAFSSPPNSSITNAVELGDRTWNKDKKFGKRRALVEEAQEVKASLKVSKNGKDSLYVGQVALDTIRRNPDLYRQLASRYILVGHSMGGVVAREYTQNSDYYHGDVDKIITLDSPHEGTGALEMQLDLVGHKWEALQGVSSALVGWSLFYLNLRFDFMAKAVAISSASWATLLAISNFALPYVIEKDLQDYSEDDPLVKYVKPGDGEVGNITYLKGIPASDSMPMFRLMGGKRSITYSDPFKDVTDWTGLFIPEGFTQGFMNFFSQMNESNDVMSMEAFTLASKAATMGLMASAASREQGTSIVPKASSWAEHTKSLTDEKADVKRWRFNAAPHDDENTWRKASELMSVVALACVAVDVSLSWFEGARFAANVAAIGGSGVTIANMLVSYLSEDLEKEISKSHNLPIDDVYDNQNTWHADYSNTLNSVGNSSINDTTINPLIMEDFLYERPFVNLALYDSRTLDSLEKHPGFNPNCYFVSNEDNSAQSCEIGLYGKQKIVAKIDTIDLKDSIGVDSVKYDTVFNEVYGPLKKEKFQSFCKDTLKFKSESDWSSVGLKVDRWEKIPGLNSEGKDALVPIRLVERYKLPAITVEGPIEKYSFVVDDLMPHRMRQIRLNFNFQEEIAWECNLRKKSTDDDACDVYKRTSGGEWTIYRSEKHPIMKNGSFVFEPQNYGYENLLALQKDNQNTVSINMVNKIGLSNMQQFNYLYKATANMVQPIWPTRNSVVTRIDGFSGYTSTLGYQGFDVWGQDSILCESVTKGSCRSFPLMDMAFASGSTGSRIFKTRQDSISAVIPEGKYRWHLKARSVNMLTGDTAHDYDNIAFSVDTTAPHCSLYVDREFINSDDVNFVARFKSNDSVLDVRAMRFVLMRNQKIVPGLKNLYDVSNKEFAIPWNGVKKDSLLDGVYRLELFAVDFAAPSAQVKDSIDILVNDIARGVDNTVLWNYVQKRADLNKCYDTVSFIIDNHAPELNDIKMLMEYHGTLGQQDRNVLKGPALLKKSGYTYVNQDELLKIEYSVQDSLYGKKRIPVMVSMNFIHLPDSASVNRARDSVWLGQNGHTDSSWNEISSMWLNDGIYKVNVTATDMAENKGKKEAGLLRVDRTAPKITGLVTTALVYPEDAVHFAASFDVSELADVDSNRAAVNCYYRVSGKDAKYTWQPILGNPIYWNHQDSVYFEFDSSSVGTQKGKRYLEVACVDVAGNVEIRTTLFHLGNRQPVITAPSNNGLVDKSIIVVKGIAPPFGADSAEYYFYRLRYRILGASSWLSDSAYVVPSNRSQDESRHNYSRSTQSNEDVLGYIYRNPDHADGYEIELGVAACETCEWRTTIDTLRFLPVQNTLLDLKLVSSKKNFRIGADTIKISSFMNGMFDNSYQLHLYAEDRNHVGLFDVSRNVWRNPFKGSYDTVTYKSEKRGVWVYEENSEWNIRWKGFSDTNKIAVSYYVGATQVLCDNNSGAVCSYDKQYTHVLPRDIKLDSVINATANAMGVDYAGAFPELKPLTNSDFTVFLTGQSGHVVLRTDSAFRIFAPNFDTSTTNIPVFMGADSVAGFANYGVSQDNLPPLMSGIMVSPENYGIVKLWDGTAVNGLYPKEGMIYLYAEATENLTVNPNVVLVKDTLMASLPSLQVVIQDSLPDYSIIEENRCADGMCTLGKLNAKFGVLYHDAYVWANVVDSNGVVVKNLVSNKKYEANNVPLVNTLEWNGTHDGKISVSSGTYRMEVTAVNADSVADTVRASSEFQITLMQGKKPMDGDPLAPYIHITEAVADTNYLGEYRYEPIADYLVKASLSGTYLPKAYRDTLSIKASSSGVQKPLGFRPKRFSLATKRHREKLTLVIVSKLRVAVVGATCDYCPFWNAYCNEVYEDDYRDFYFVDTVSFTELNKSKTIRLESTMNDINRALSDSRFHELSLTAYTLKEIETSIGSIPQDHNTQNLSFDQTYLTPVWKKTVSVYNSATSYGYSSENDYTGCTPRIDSTKGYYEFIDCIYGSENYDPNANLFDVKLSPVDGAFHSDVGQVHNKCKVYNATRNERIKFDVSLTIPDSYWNSPFGMDNLVNRTVRFDHTNQTMFGKNGYMKALFDLFGNDSMSRAAIANYYDGTDWNKSYSDYGLLTPFETQRFVYIPANVMPGGLNTFLFADEDSSHIAKSSFDLKFYNVGTQNQKFQVNLYGQVNGIDKKYPYVMPDSVRSPYFDSLSSVYFYIGLNENWSIADAIERDSVVYPAPLTWKDSMDNICKDDELLKTKLYEASCFKYYNLGSKVHYYVGDYSDNDWLSVFTFSDGTIKNFVNNSENLVYPEYYDALRTGFASDIVNKINEGSINSSMKISLANYLNPANYKNGKFFVDLNSVTEIQNLKDGIPDVIKLSGGFNMGFGPNVSGDTLYLDEVAWNKKIVYRRTNQDQKLPLPLPSQSTALSIHDLYRFQSWSRGYLCDEDDFFCGSYNDRYWNENDWIKKVRVDNVELQHLDSSRHSHFEAKSRGDLSDLVVSYKVKADSARPAEFVELRGNLKAGTRYSISYLTEDSLLNTFWQKNAEKNGDQRLDWFNMSRLNGNTTFILSWGDGDNELYYKKLNLNVGKDVDNTAQTTVESLFGELSVTFPANSLNRNENITVRTADSKDYPFKEFNDMAITGPIVEVLPHMTFENELNLPRIQMKISKQEIDAMDVAPQKLKLYKVDFDNKQLVPLVNALYGYLNENGGAIKEKDGNVAMCTSPLDPNCHPANDDWAYMLISAETKTFSVFVALDSLRAEMPKYSIEVLPAVASTESRDVRVTGLKSFEIFVDDDPFYKDSIDQTPAALVATIGNSTDTLVHLSSLPWNGNGLIDSVWIFVKPKVNDTTSLFVLPKSVVAIRVPAEFACSVEKGPLWLGLDNGYMTYPVSCTHPGHSIVTLYKGEQSVVEITTASNDSIYFDGRKGLTKIPNGMYESRYVGMSVLGNQQQIAGPMVYTDSARPIMNEWSVTESTDVLARIYNVSAVVTDEKSGISFAKITAILGNDTVAVKRLIPDSTGNVRAEIRLSRKQLSECGGCRLTMNMRVEDLGHNHADTLWRSDKLFPYPTELALWYPAREGTGNSAYEFIGTGHHLNLSMFRPWLSGSGLYFYHPGDSAVGAGRVDLGTSSEYSMEARVSPGNAQDTLWRRVMGFVGTSGMKIEVQNQGRNLRLVENNRIWTLRGYLPSNAWSHVVVAVDSQDVRFYIDGAMVKRMPALPMEREFYGTFSMGELESKNFVGHVADVRFYTKALNGDEVLALTLPITDEGDTTEIHTIIVLGNEMEGAGRQFSCAVSGNGYFVGSDAGTGLNMSVDIPASADYKAIVYARSAIKTSAVIKIGAQGATTYSGSVKLENTWRPVEIANVKIPLNSGMQRITLNVPDGVQIAGIAFTNSDEVKPSQISWKSNSEIAGNETVVVQKVKSSVRFEGYPSDKTMIRPRIRLKNISSETINGFKVRYYFRGESPESVNADAYFPGEDSLGLVVSAEGYNTGYVEWAFDTTRILPGGRPYFGDGPLMGIYNDGNVPWYAEDDPSYVLPGMAATDVDGFIDDFGIVVLDSENNLIGGHCVEMEDPIEAMPPSVRVFAADMRDDQTRASEIALKLENLGGTSLRKYDVRYYFLVEEGLQPIFDINNQPLFVDGAEMAALGNSRYQVNIHVGDVSLAPHNVWADEFKFAIHVGNWDPLWNASDDPSHEGLTKSYVVTSKICVYDSTGKKIYGEDPVWEEPKIVAPRDNQDSLVADYGYDSGISIPVIRTPEGLILSLDGYPYVLLDLVYANGTPIRRIYSGTVMPGEQFIAVDWTGIDLSHTYLVLRKNSQIVSTKLLSNL